MVMLRVVLALIFGFGRWAATSPIEAAPAAAVRHAARVSIGVLVLDGEQRRA